MGAYGEVLSCYTKEEKVKRAVKVISKKIMSRDEEKGFQREIRILKKLDHPNILKLYEVFEDSKAYYLVTEYCKGGELFEEITRKEKLSEADAANIIH